MPISLEVWGDYALFTRPEMKVERVSYDVMTPSAARGLIEAIYWHPGLRWVIDRIHVCAPIRFTNLRRNEVKSTRLRPVCPHRHGARARESCICVPANDIQQRAALLLRDVRYVIEAHFDMTDKAAPGDNPGKFQDIVKRRIQRGQFYHQPCFGCREFPAQFRWCDEPPPCPEELRGRTGTWAGCSMTWTTPNPEDIRPLFFRAKLEDGVLRCPGPGQRGGAGMILQALTDYYRVLERQGKIAAPGWSPVKVSFALCIGDDGTLEQVIDIQTEQAAGKEDGAGSANPLPPRACEADGGRGRQLPLRQFRLSCWAIDNKGKPQRTPGVL